MISFNLIDHLSHDIVLNVNNAIAIVTHNSNNIVHIAIAAHFSILTFPTTTTAASSAIDAMIM